MNSIKFTCFFLALSILFSCSKESNNTNQDKQAIQDLLVKDNEITGWNYVGSGWIANNISELTTYIDGMADLYQKYGFLEAAYQKYSGKVNNVQVELEVTIYNQLLINNATGVFNDSNNGLNGAINTSNKIGDQSKYIRNGGLSQVMAFTKGKYFVYIQISADTEESLNVITQFAKNVNTKIKI